MSRSELVETSGLNRTTVGALVGELADRGLAYETPATPNGSPGRPSAVVYPMSEGAVAVAVDISIDSISVASIGFGGSVIDLARAHLPRDRHSVEDAVAAAAELYHSRISASLPAQSLMGVGVAVAGIASSHNGVVRLAPNLGWIDVPLGTMIADAFETARPVYVGNEADLGALAEHTRGIAAGVDNVVYLLGRVGVGGGLIVDGGPMGGAGGYVGEVGHIVVNPQGHPCACGSHGCWETEGGEGAILRRTGYPEGDGRSGIEALIASAKRGDHAVLESVRETGRWLGIGIASLVNIFNPSTVVLAGLFARIAPFAWAGMQDEVNRRTLAAAREQVEIVASDLGEQAPLLGAAELAFQPLLLDPPAVWTTDEPLAGSVVGRQWNRNESVEIA
ncbi:MAG: ROK family protein [Acidimicrobiaceae bacterium]|nr:ROK family protein [Acidimicrobiaceae bacterium]